MIFNMDLISLLTSKIKWNKCRISKCQQYKLILTTIKTAPFSYKIQAVIIWHHLNLDKNIMFFLFIQVFSIICSATKLLQVSKEEEGFKTPNLNTQPFNALWDDKIFFLKHKHYTDMYIVHIIHTYVIEIAKM